MENIYDYVNKSLQYRGTLLYQQFKLSENYLGSIYKTILKMWVVFNNLQLCIFTINGINRDHRDSKNISIIFENLEITVSEI